MFKFDLFLVDFFLLSQAREFGLKGRGEKGSWLTAPADKRGRYLHYRGLGSPKLSISGSGKEWRCM